MYRRLALAVLAVACFCVHAQVPTVEPTFTNAQVTRQPLSGSLESTLKSLAHAPAPLWVAYTVPAEAPYRSGWSRTRMIYLEPGNHSSYDSRGGSESIAHDSFSVLYRLAGGKVDQVRSAGPEDTLDAGGLRVVWLQGVSAEASIARLEAQVLAQPSAKLADTAVFLISLHRSPAAVPALVALARPGNDLELRHKATFWLASQRGHDGFVAIQSFAQHDPDALFREKLTFDLTLSKDLGALPELVRMAHDDASPRVRQQAQFWMAQSYGKSGGKLVSGALDDAAEHDPDASVRKKAVFAISRLPQPEATDKLVNLAGSSTDPEVRKQAVFWLGQSNDPKALAFLTRLLIGPSH